MRCPMSATSSWPGATVAQVEPQAKMMRDQIVATYGKPIPPAPSDRAEWPTPAAQAKIAGWIENADRGWPGGMYEDMTTDLRPDMAAIATPITLVYPIPAACRRSAPSILPRRICQGAERQLRAGRRSCALRHARPAASLRRSGARVRQIAGRNQAGSRASASSMICSARRNSCVSTITPEAAAFSRPARAARRR